MLNNSFKIMLTGMAAVSLILATAPVALAKNTTNVSIATGNAEKLSDAEVAEMTKQGIALADGVNGAQDLGKAYELLSLASDKGNSDAQYRLGMMYFRGEGVEQNQDKANELISEAANKGNSDAIAWMVMMSNDSAHPSDPVFDLYKWSKLGAEHGDVRSMIVFADALIKGETPDGKPHMQEAITWLTKAKDMGDAEAATELGRIYIEGNGVPKDYKLALESFSLASKEDDAVATYYLGYMYENGLGVDKDYAKAAKYYEDSSSFDNADATYALALLYESGKGVTKDATKASELFEQACLFGIDDACEKKPAEPDANNAIMRESADSDLNAETELGLQFFNGEGKPKDYREAFAHFEKGSRDNDPVALYHLGYMYEHGLGVAKDEVKAAHNYEEAANRDHGDATYALGLMYKDGRGVTKDEAKANGLLEAACDFGVTEACISDIGGDAGANNKSADEVESMVNSGINKLKGINGPKDYQLAFQFFQYGSKQDDPVANYYLGYMYEHGLYVKKDYKMAYKYYMESANFDNADATYALGLLYKEGKGVKKDLNQAKAFIDQACEFGVKEACAK